MTTAADDALADLLAEVRGCRVCRDAPCYGGPLPHEPRPIVQAGSRARILIVGQAPGTRVHASGRPFTDPSGVRLRAWLGVDEATFYDAERIAIVPMGFCFPGLDAAGADLPPRRECAPLWHDRVLARLPNVALALLVGRSAQTWHLTRAEAAGGMTATVARWRDVVADRTRPRRLPLPHPSWRNSGWLKRNAWFADELLPELQADVAALLANRNVRIPAA